MRGLALEDSLPYENHKKIREDIPVGVYDVVADFGQSRGGNTATILPNQSYLARRYGRAVLLRANIMREPKIFQGTSHTWEAALAPEHKNDLSADGNFYRTLWHEVGHYLGVDRTKDGRDLEALHENSLRFDPATSKRTSITTSTMKLLGNCWRSLGRSVTRETKRLLIGSLNSILTGTRTCMAA